MSVRRMRVQSQQITVGVGAASGQYPGPQLPRPRQPQRWHGLDRAARPLRRHGTQSGIDRGTYQRRVFFGLGDFSRHTGLVDHLAQRLCAPGQVHDHRQSGPTADRDDLACRGKHPGEVADRRRHRLRREKRQLAHVNDSKRPVDDARRGVRKCQAVKPPFGQSSSENPPSEPESCGSRGGCR